MSPLRIPGLTGGKFGALIQALCEEYDQLAREVQHYRALAETGNVDHRMQAPQVHCGNRSLAAISPSERPASPPPDKSADRVGSPRASLNSKESEQTPATGSLDTVGSAVQSGSSPRRNSRRQEAPQVAQQAALRGQMSWRSESGLGKIDRWDADFLDNRYRSESGVPALMAAGRQESFDGQQVIRYNSQTSEYSSFPQSRGSGRLRMSVSGRFGSLIFPKIFDKWVPNTDEDGSVDVDVTQMPSRSTLHKNASRLSKYPLETGLTHKSTSRWARRFVLHPNSPKRCFWELVATVSLFYDIITIPLDWCGFLAERPSGQGLSIELFVHLFWSLDVVSSFCTGVYVEGTLELRPREIAKTYIRGWFAFDSACVLLDWVHFCVSTIGDNNLPIPLGGMARMIRALRLVRGYKLQQKLVRILEEMHSEKLQNWLNIWVLAGVILVACHYMACGWYIIGMYGDEDQSWIAFYMQDDASPTYKYLTALHWSLTQFTPATMEVMPKNFEERLFAVISVFCAMLTFSTFVSSITTHMTTLRKITSEEGKQHRILHNFFQERKISGELGHMIWRYLRGRKMDFQKKLHLDDVVVFKALPRGVLSKLAEELFVPIVKECPFFFKLGVSDYQGLIGLCNTALAEISHMPGERAFEEGHRGNAMYFTSSGHTMYEHRDARLNVVLSSGSWACEPSLWLRWWHCGSLICNTCCEVLKLPAETFRSSVGDPGTLTLAFVRAYVKNFVAMMMENGPYGTWCTDVWLQRDLLEAVADRAQDEALHTGFVEDELSTNSGDVRRPSVFSDVSVKPVLVTPRVRQMIMSVRSWRCGHRQRSATDSSGGCESEGSKQEPQQERSGATVSESEAPEAQEPVSAAPSETR